MSQPFDLSRFLDLPPEVVRAFAAQQAELEAAQFDASVERAAHQHEQAMVAEKDAFIVSATSGSSCVTVGVCADLPPELRGARVDGLERS